MSTTVRHSTDQHKGIFWAIVSGAQSVVFVARVDDRPVAVLEMQANRRFRLTTCSGTEIGTFASVDEAQAAFEAWIASK